MKSNFNDGKLRNMTSVYISQDNKILLLYRKGGRVVNDVWVGSAGGHFEEFELNDARACMLRELKEELNLSEKMLENIKLRYVTLRRTKGEIRQNYYFFAKLNQDYKIELNSNEGIAKWFDIEEIKSLEMPYTAKYVIEHYVDIGIKDDLIYGGIANSEKVVFIELPEF
ncbi:NUDIX domain-containing protein [Sedimentibacter sp. zth1]|nr:NUDIX domain-containing protein [Sedimentibacter sp. zth1]